ncbi:hypothetical protein ACFQL4_18685 [Halosimplex aquaticum]
MHVWRVRVALLEGPFAVAASAPAESAVAADPPPATAAADGQVVRFSTDGLPAFASAGPGDPAANAGTPAAATTAIASTNTTPYVDTARLPNLVNSDWSPITVWDCTRL